MAIENRYIEGVLAGSQTANQAGAATTTTLCVGTVLGKNTSTNKFYLVNSGNVDGTQTASVVLAQTTETSGGDTTVPMLTNAEFKGSTLRFGGSDVLSTHFDTTTGRTKARTFYFL